ncbi:MAG: glycoside hydrolase family 3 N-terminal domain-containing protein [Cyanobacteria bacterium P01_G01_bin.49]
MIVVRASGHLFDHQIRYPFWEAPNHKLQSWLETLNLGGVILLGGSGAELWLRSQQLQQWSPTPLFIAADIEEGVGQRFSGATYFPPPMALGEIAKNDLTKAINYAIEMGKITAQEALSIGINWILTPVVDVNNNPDNPVINIRSFGETPEIVSQLATAFIQGANAYPALTTAKHFPGHGDTSSDSHLNLPLINHDNARLESLELLPFKAAIKANVDSIMTAHLLIAAWDTQFPATLSQTILTEKLRKILGFQGLIITDALVMGGVANYAPPEEVVVRAVEAGADVLLMPDDPEKAIDAIDQAIASGRLTPARIQASVKRIWQAKEKIFKQKQHNLSIYQLASEEARTTVKDIIKSSLKKSNQSLGQLPSEKPKRNLIVVDDLLTADFLDRQMPAVTIPKQLGYELQLVDQNTLHNVLSDERTTLLQIFVRGNPFRGNAGFNDNSQEFYDRLLRKSKIHGLIIYGSPYILDWFRPLMSSKLPWVFSYGQMAESQVISCQTLFELSSLELSKMSGNLKDIFI